MKILGLSDLQAAAGRISLFDPGAGPGVASRCVLEVNRSSFTISISLYTQYWCVFWSMSTLVTKYSGLIGHIFLFWSKKSAKSVWKDKCHKFIQQNNQKRKKIHIYIFIKTVQFCNKSKFDTKHHVCLRDKKWKKVKARWKLVAFPPLVS